MKRLSLLTLAILSLVSTGRTSPIAYENFSYPLGSTLPNQNGGTGWMGSWIGPNLGGTTGGSDQAFALTNGLSWTNGPGYVAGLGDSIFDADDGGPNHDIGHGDARQWFDPSNPLLPFDTVYGTNIWFSFLARYDVVSTSGGIVAPFEDSFQAFSGVGVTLKGGSGALQVYIRQHGAEMSTNTVNYLQASGTLTNVALVVGRFRLGPVVPNPLFDPGNDRLDVWLNQTREPTNDSPLFMAGFSALRAAPYSQGYLGVRSGGNCRMTIDELKIGTTFADVVPPSAASANPRPASPFLSLQKSGPAGLQINAAAGTSNHFNQIVSAPAFECSWVGSATPDYPATYSFTITNAPAPGATNFLAYVWLIANPNGFVSAEISNPDVVRLRLQSDGQGAAFATLGYKVNSTNDTSMFSGSGFLCGITNAPFVGTWTLTLTNDTDFTLTAPNGASARGSMQSAADTNSFASGVQFFLGVNPNGQPNIGRFITVSSIRIGITNANSATTNTITSDFTTGAPLDSSTWNILADDPASILIVPQESVYRAEWRNAVGAGVGQNSLQITNTLTGSAAWTALPQGALLGDGTNIVFISRQFATNTASFFRVQIPYSP